MMLVRSMPSWATGARAWFSSTSPQNWSMRRTILRICGKILPDAKVVVLTEMLCSQTLAACLGAGAHGYLIKDISVEALLQSLRLVELGEKVFPTHLAALLVNGMMASTAPARQVSSHGLSEREGQVLQCLVQGGTNKMIANRLGITEATIKVHMKSLLRKINASNRTQAAIWALNHGLAPNTPQTGTAA